MRDTHRNKIEFEKKHLSKQMVQSLHGLRNVICMWYLYVIRHHIDTYDIYTITYDMCISHSITRLNSFR